MREGRKSVNGGCDIYIGDLTIGDLMGDLIGVRCTGVVYSLYYPFYSYLFLLFHSLFIFIWVFITGDWLRAKLF